MMKKRFTAIIAMSLFVLFPSARPASADRVLVPFGAVWKYLDDGSNQGTAWREPGFDDSAWAAGPGQLGYGDSDEATVVSYGPNSSAKYITTYFRRAFVVSNPAEFGNLTLRWLRDDGGVVYLNGVGVATNNMPAGAITATTLAAAAIEDAIITTTIAPSLLVVGTNVIAVEIHQISGTSSDISFNLSLTSSNALRRGPFVQRPNSNAVTIVWQTIAPADSEVEYGLTPAFGSSVIDSALVTNHVIHLPGLLAGTNYHYRVRSGGTNLTEAILRTPPANPQFRFVVIGDFGTGSVQMSNVAAQVNARDFDLILTVGDNIYPNGEAELYNPYWFSLYGSTMARVPTMPALGNHDVNPGSNNGQPFIDNFYLPTNGPAAYLERNYSFDYGPSHFVVIDSNPFANSDATAMAAIRTWVSNDLAATTQPWKFAIYHHPPYTSLGSHGDQLNVQSMLTPLFAQFGVQIAFQGHNHFYERINAIGGVNYITTGAGGQSLYPITTRKDYSAVINTTNWSFSLVELDGTRLKLHQIDRAGNQFDELNVDIGHPFQIDGLLDNAGWVRADNGLKLHAAIRQNWLYLAMQDAGEGSDHFLYVHDQTSTNRPANWSKAGTVVQWSAFLADENEGAFQRWFGNAEQQLNDFEACRSMTSGLNNNGAAGNGVLEGTLQLVTHFGSFPQQLYLAGAAYTTTNGGSLVVQVPVGNGSANISQGEFLLVNTRDIALDLPVANAGTNLTREAGLPVTLTGTASLAPSGLPLTYAWTQLAGVPVTLVNSNTASAGFSATTNVNAVLTFQLTVHDTRFASNATVTVTLTELVDADGDGLTDQEELTGLDNNLTLANPSGQITDPTKSDTDGDGMTDGAEALAGTNPTDPASVLRVTDSTVNPGGFRLDWTAIPGKTYAVEFRDDLANTWSNLTTVVAITSQTNVTDSSAVGQTKRFYRVRVEP